MGRPQQPGYDGGRGRHCYFRAWRNPINGKTYPVIYTPGAQIRRHHEFRRCRYCEYESTVGLLGYHSMEPRQALVQYGLSNTGGRNPRDSTARRTQPPRRAIPPVATTPALIQNNTNFSSVLPGFEFHFANRGAEYDLSVQWFRCQRNHSVTGSTIRPNITNGLWSDVTTNKDDIATGDPQYGHQQTRADPEPIQFSSSKTTTR